jgi:hypothetical protein
MILFFGHLVDFWYSLGLEFVGKCQQHVQNIFIQENMLSCL